VPLVNSVRNGAISSATSFITETGSGSAAELMSGRRDIAETMSTAVTEVNDTSDVPSGTWEKNWLRRSISTRSDGDDFL